MALALAGKKAIVAEVNQEAKASISGLVADYRGLSVDKITKLRQDAREKGVYLKVVRNTLAKRALSDTDFKCLDEVLIGPTLIALSKNEPSAPARLFKAYIKELEHLKVKALVISGRLMQADELDYVAKLPTRDEAIATLMRVMLAPIEKFVRTLAEPPAKLVRTIAAIRDKKEA